MLTRQGAVLLKKDVSVSLQRRIRQELEVTPFSPNYTATPFRVYLETPTQFIVPQFWTTGDISLRDTRASGQDVGMVFAGSLRESTGQVELVRHVMDHYGKKKRGACILCAKTGQGKTTMALSIAAMIQKKTLVLVHKAFLADQWVAQIKKFLPNTTVTQYGNKCLDTTGAIVVATIQTVLSRGLSEDVREAFGLIIIDEVHHIGAPSFSKVLFGLNAPVILGLTATPERLDQMSCLLHWFCGPLVQSSTEQTLTHTVTLVRRTFFKEIDIPQTRTGDVAHAALLTQLAEDDERTAFIVKTVVEHISTTRDCLILSHRRSHCFLLAECLRQQGYDALTYLGGDKKVPSSTVIVSTYALVSEGFDEPRLSALVLATPASNITQAVGRILRATGEKCIVDISDSNPVCYAQATKRKSFYRAAGYLTIEKIQKIEKKEPREQPNMFII